jgi:hypothetical protein
MGQIAKLPPVGFTWLATGRFLQILSNILQQFVSVYLKIITIRQKRTLNTV